MARRYRGLREMGLARWLRGVGGRMARRHRGLREMGLLEVVIHVHTQEGKRWKEWLDVVKEEWRNGDGGLKVRVGGAAMDGDAYI